MDNLKLVKPDCMVKHIKDTVKVIPDIIPSIPHVACIKTDTSFLFTSDFVKHRCKFLEILSNFTPLSRHCFQ